MSLALRKRYVPDLCANVKEACGESRRLTADNFKMRELRQPRLTEEAAV
ncbi:MAG: hypothetical protein ACJAWL_000827 [Motiliproteus sp.]|jgi:hypothetical protein